MIASKGLLTGTLLVTFVSGTAIGWRTSDRTVDGTAANPYSVDYVYSQEFDAMRARGYTDQDITEARKHYSDYLESYRVWWDEFQKAHAVNLDPTETRFEERMDALDIRVRDRVTGESGK